MNIDETPLDISKDQYGNQDEYNVHYGTNNSSSNNKPKQKCQPAIQNKISILQRDQPSIDSKNQNSNLPCMLCKSQNHATLWCLQTRQLRDKKWPVHPNFCETHCGRVFALCKKRLVL